MSILLGIFFILHALVHLLYAGQAQRFFELRPGLGLAGWFMVVFPAAGR